MGDARRAIRLGPWPLPHYCRGIPDIRKEGSALYLLPGRVSSDTSRFTRETR
jgi:hypothetical protein